MRREPHIDDSDSTNVSARRTTSRHPMSWSPLRAGTALDVHEWFGQATRSNASTVTAGFNPQQVALRPPQNLARTNGVATAPTWSAGGADKILLGGQWRYKSLGSPSSMPGQRDYSSNDTSPHIAPAVIVHHVVPSVLTHGRYFYRQTRDDVYSSIYGRRRCNEASDEASDSDDSRERGAHHHAYCVQHTCVYSANTVHAKTEGGRRYACRRPTCSQASSQRPLRASGFPSVVSEFCACSDSISLLSCGAVHRLREAHRRSSSRRRRWQTAQSRKIGKISPWRGLQICEAYLISALKLLSVTEGRALRQCA